MMACLCHIDLNVAAFQHLLESVAYPEPAWACWSMSINGVLNGGCYSFDCMRTRPHLHRFGRAMALNSALSWRLFSREPALARSRTPGCVGCSGRFGVSSEEASTVSDFHPASGMWIEPRIPHKFNYPIEPPKRLPGNRNLRSKRMDQCISTLLRTATMEGNKNAG